MSPFKSFKWLETNFDTIYEVHFFCNNWMYMYVTWCTVTKVFYACDNLKQMK